MKLGERISRLTNRIVRVENESQESARARHVRRMDAAERNEITELLRRPTFDPAGLSFSFDEQFLGVPGLPRGKEVVIFNRVRIPLS